MKNRLTKKQLLQFCLICKQNGYWSKEVYDFCSQYYPFSKAYQTLHQVGKNIYVHGYKNCAHYELIKQNGLLPKGM